MKKVNDNEMILEDYETPLHRQWINTKKMSRESTVWLTMFNLCWWVYSVRVVIKLTAQQNRAEYIFTAIFYLFIISSSLLAALGLRAA